MSQFNQYRKPGRPPKSKTHPRSIAIAKTKAEVWRLRTEEALTYRQIAQKMGIAMTAVFRYLHENVNKIESEIVQRRAFYIEAQLEELEDMLRLARAQLASIPQTTSTKDAIASARARADLIRTINSLLERQSKLLGLDAPTQVQHIDDTPTAIVFNVSNQPDPQSDDENLS